jgi:hypothetical protein
MAYGGIMKLDGDNRGLMLIKIQDNRLATKCLGSDLSQPASKVLYLDLITRNTAFDTKIMHGPLFVGGMQFVNGSALSFIAPGDQCTKENNRRNNGNSQ